jgi:23S rRNA maturation-related 3'-5' exoribonuclease YhaM
MEKITAFYKLMHPYVPGNVTDWLKEKGFFTSPASTKYHGNYEGGLFDHSLAVTEALVELTENNGLVWQNPRSPYIVGMFHDLCKIDQYRTDNKISGYFYREDALPGHGDKSVIFLSQFYELTEEEKLCIRYHMGAFTDKEEWREYTQAIHEYGNVLWTHHADMIASHIKGV